MRKRIGEPPALRVNDADGPMRFLVLRIRFDCRKEVAQRGLGAAFLEIPQPLVAVCGRPAARNSLLRLQAAEWGGEHDGRRQQRGRLKRSVRRPGHGEPSRTIRSSPPLVNSSRSSRFC